MYYHISVLNGWLESNNLSDGYKCWCEDEGEHRNDVQVEDSEVAGGVSNKEICCLIRASVINVCIHYKGIAGSQEAYQA